LRAAVVARPDRIEADLVRCQREVEIAGHEEIEPAIAIVIEERDAGAPPPFANAGLRRRIGERSVAIVAVKRGGLEPGDKQIEALVTVDVAHRDTHAIPAEAHAGSRRDIREAECPPPVGCDRQIVAKQAASIVALRCGARLPRGRCSEAGPSLDEEDVEIPVAVVVEERHAGAHLLWYVVLAGLASLVREFQSGGLGRIDEERALRVDSRHD
jgi:hypothetical protein